MIRFLRLFKAYRELYRECEQLQVQLAGVSVVALGGTQNPAVSGDYGWSPAYQHVLELRMKWDKTKDAQEEIAALLEKYNL